VVRAAVDAAWSIEGAAELVAFAEFAGNPPEARLVAESRAIAMNESRAAVRMALPVDVERLRAACAGLSDLFWLDAFKFTTMLDGAGVAGAVPRETPLDDDELEALLAAGSNE